MRTSFVRDRVRELMQERGWSSRQLARRAGIAPSTVCRLLRATNATVPQDDTALALERALGVASGTLSGMDPVPQQIGLWPGLVDTDASAPELVVLRALRLLGGNTRLEAARAAVAAVIDHAVADGVVDPVLHECLADLDRRRVERRDHGRRRLRRRSGAPRSLPRTLAAADARPDLPAVG